MDKIVLHYNNGSVAKGRAFDFSPLNDSFHFLPLDGELSEIWLEDLKAIFFVKDFDGNADYNEKKTFGDEAVSHGNKVEVVFRDGELQVGATKSDAGTKGFFLFPADPGSNNMGIFCVASSVEKITKI